MGDTGLLVSHAFDENNSLRSVETAGIHHILRCVGGKASGSIYNGYRKEDMSLWTRQG